MSGTLEPYQRRKSFAREKNLSRKSYLRLFRAIANYISRKVSVLTLQSGNKAIFPVSRCQNVSSGPSFILMAMTSRDILVMFGDTSSSVSNYLPVCRAMHSQTLRADICTLLLSCCAIRLCKIVDRLVEVCRQQLSLATLSCNTGQPPVFHKCL